MVRLPMKRRTSLPLLLLSVVWMGNTETLQSKVQLQSLYFLEERELTPPPLPSPALFPIILDKNELFVM